MRTQVALVAMGLVAIAGAARPAAALESSGFGLSVLVDGDTRPEYMGRGNVYVEALRGKEYTLRITNPLPCRVAVALSVDGLNTIDARRTSAGQARKWVLDPYETIEIQGWQVNDRAARRFYFTGERGSYGAYLGKTDDLGVVEAVFFRERPRPEPLGWVAPRPMREGGANGRAEPEERRAKADHERQRLGAVGSLEGGVSKDSAQAPAPLSSAAGAAEAKQADEYAATGIGDKADHRVHQIHLDLESTPSAALRIRYGFRTELVQLGVWPRPPRHRAALDRRERASGFSGPYCPDPARDED